MEREKTDSKKENIQRDFVEERVKKEFQNN